MKVVVLVSGGMDSVTALYDSSVRNQVAAAVSFDYGSKHNAKEIPEARFHCEQLAVPLEVIALEFIGRLFKSDLLAGGGPVPDGHYEEANMKRTVVPFRNGILLSVAAGYAESIGAEGLVIAAHAGDHAIYPDCREAFMQSMGDALRLGTYSRVELVRPFIAMTKGDIVKRGTELGVDFLRTWSCYKGGKIHCGTCGTCVERREAFLLAGIADPTAYASKGPIPSAPVVRE